MIGFRLINLLPPGAPSNFTLSTQAGHWLVSKSSTFATDLPKINQGMCAETYDLVFPLPSDNTRSVVKSAAFDELLPICLAMSFVTGMAVTFQRSMPNSAISFVQVGPHFPRPRGMNGAMLCVSTIDEFVNFVERFTVQYPILDSSEKLRLLSHYYIDACSSWSLEDLYLSGSTLLQIIAGTEESSGRPFAFAHAATKRNSGARSRNMAKPSFFNFLAGAANRAGISTLRHDVVGVRNSLIHNGTLKSARLQTQVDAAQPIAEAMQWVDDYIYSILQLGSVPIRRHIAHNYAYAMNSFSF